MTIDPVETMLRFGRCPDCFGRAFRSGPRGGASLNIECRSCKSRFNVAEFMGQLVFAERIQREDEGGSHWREDLFPK